MPSRNAGEGAPHRDRKGADVGQAGRIVEKMVAGRIRKFLKEITLLGQPFVKDPDVTVGQLLAEAERDGHRVRALRSR